MSFGPLSTPIYIFIFLNKYSFERARKRIKNYVELAKVGYYIKGEGPEERMRDYCCETYKPSIQMHG
jgi:hypothetical protein